MRNWRKRLTTGATTMQCYALIGTGQVSRAAATTPLDGTAQGTPLEPGQNNGTVKMAKPPPS
jgi:hypothetical protein